MILTQQPSPVVTPSPISAGISLPPATFAHIRRRMMLDCCKWDVQVGDVTTLADFPLIMHPKTWRQLQHWAEQLTSEMLAAEHALLQRPDLQKRLGVPRAVRHALALSTTSSQPATRTVRFDFHWTTDGWKISEANSDVPGGFTEASHFSKMMAHAIGLATAGDPLSPWADAIATQAAGCPAALITAPGFMEDQQIMAVLLHALADRACPAILCKPENLRWHNGHPHLAQIRLGTIVRFYQAEWLASLPRKTAWHHFFAGSQVPISNPGVSAVTESKRFPLAWDQLDLPMPTWRALLPETRDPRDVDFGNHNAWILKTAYCNTGDTVTVPGLLPAADWARALRSARWHPGDWVAQRRFTTLPLATPDGQMFPCIGVYTINGRATGAYVRLGRSPVVNFEAVDAALLLSSPADDEGNTDG